MSANPFLTQFLEDLRSRYPIDGADVTYAQWISLNTKLAGRPFSYDGFEFQIDIVNDMSKNLSVIKPSQVGLTEVQVRKFLAILARNRGTSGIFTFPDERMYKKNSKTRIKPVVSQPAFSTTGLDDDKPLRNMQLYEVNGSFAHIMGMTEGEATSTPADFLFHDEIDLSDQTMIGLFQSRLQNSVHRVTQAFSTPTHPGFGIDARYNASDKRVYMAKCRCGHWQHPTFTMPFLCLPGYHGEGMLDELDADGVSKIDLANSYVKCERCSQPLNLRDPSLREWVPELPSRLARGYKVSPFSPTHGRLDITYILNQLLTMKQLDQLKGWYNTVLGETYSDGNSKLEPDMVRAIMKSPSVPDISPTMPVALGCDMGKTCHLVLGIVTRQGVMPFLFEQVPSGQIRQRIAQHRAKYNIITGCVDRLPYTPDANAIRDASNRTILPMQYSPAPNFSLKYDEYENIDHVHANRTQVIDAMVRDVRTRTMEMSGYGGLKEVVVEHLCDMVRIEVDERPASWEKLTGSDHFFHALALLLASVKVREIVGLLTPQEARQFIGLIGVPSSTAKPVRVL